MCAALAVYLASNAEHSVFWPATLIEGNSQSEFWILHSSTKRTANGASVFEPWRALPETALSYLGPTARWKYRGGLGLAAHVHAEHATYAPTG